LLQANHKGDNQGATRQAMEDSGMSAALHPALLPPAKRPRKSDILNVLDHLEEWLWFMMSDPAASAEQRADIMVKAYDPVMATLVAAQRRPIARRNGGRAPV
jgi:hypothetical protein